MVNGKKMVNVILLGPVTGIVVCVFTPHTACRSAAPIAEKVTHVNYTLFPTAARIRVHVHVIYIYHDQGYVSC